MNRTTNNVVMDDDDCCGGTPLVDNQQHHHHHSHHAESTDSASSKLVQLLMCLPALRQADQLIRQYWTRVHRENQQQLAAATQVPQPQNAVASGAGVGFTRQSTAADRLSSIGNGNIGGGTTVVKMNKLFVEMLEACLR